MKILYYEVRHFSPNFHEFTMVQKQYLPKSWRKKNCQNPFQAIIRLKKRRKKEVAWTTKSLV